MALKIKSMWILEGQKGEADKHEVENKRVDLLVENETGDTYFRVSPCDEYANIPEDEAVLFTPDQVNQLKALVALARKEMAARGAEE